MISFLAKGKGEIWKNAKHQGRSVCSVGAERVSDDATYLVKFICIKSAAEILTLNFFQTEVRNTLETPRTQVSDDNLRT